MQELDFSSLTPQAIATLWSGMLISLQVAATALGVGLVWGTVLAMMRLSRFRVLSFLAATYINLFRSIPLAMVLLSFYLIVPQLLRSLFDTSMDTRLLSALVGFALFESAYFAEIMRAGIQSVSKGQLAAAVALGMKPLQAMRLPGHLIGLRDFADRLLHQCRRHRRTRWPPGRNDDRGRRGVFCDLLHRIATGETAAGKTGGLIWRLRRPVVQARYSRHRRCTACSLLPIP
jgi:His/Glu/Gln/Arg/opine family amino acid ABC transporter permease subunit